MPYKRKKSPYYYIRRRRLPGYGDTGRLSSGVTSKRLARDMERALEDVAQRALENPTWYPLLDAVCKARTIPPARLLRARRSGELESLKRSLNDPLLVAAIERFEEATQVKRQVRCGLVLLREYAPGNTRLGDLTAKRITSMCMQAERDGRKRNSVRRMLLRAISLLLRFHLGNAERNRIFAEVRFAAEDDTREVHLSPAEIKRLLQSCDTLGYPELGLLVRLALQTSADRGVLLRGTSADGPKRGLLVRDLRIYQDNKTSTYSGEAFLPDTKTKDRTRTVPLTDGLCRALLPLCQGKAPDDPVFNFSYSQMDAPWQRVRKQARLPRLRFKDLRAQVSIYGEEAGIPQTVLMRTMGHSDEAMTRRYQQRAAVMSPEQAEAIEQAMLSDEATRPGEAMLSNEVAGGEKSLKVG